MIVPINVFAEKNMNVPGVKDKVENYKPISIIPTW